MRRRASRDNHLITKVNVVPIIDVSLVLVTILLVTAPMLSIADLPVDLPKAHTREAEDQRNVSITRAIDGEVAVDRERVPRERLVETLRAALARPGNAGVLVVIRADAGVPYGEIRSLLGDARAAGARRLAVATRQNMGANP